MDKISKNDYQIKVVGMEYKLFMVYKEINSNWDLVGCSESYEVIEYMLEKNMEMRNKALAFNESN